MADTTSPKQDPEPIVEKTSTPEAETVHESVSEHSKANAEAKRYRLKYKEMKDKYEKAANSLEHSLQKEKEAEQLTQQYINTMTAENAQKVHELSKKLLFQIVEGENNKRIKDNARTYCIDPEALTDWLNEHLNKPLNVEFRGRSDWALEELVEQVPADFIAKRIIGQIWDKHRYMRREPLPMNTPHVRESIPWRTPIRQSQLGGVFTSIRSRGGFY
ncbi:hypothetical protein [Alloscardovia criceti]|uniref:hypothetical protein n=1 Tax=Alloscardovia criceti TaxID=356828 RepID=UPI00037F4F17|nr:hypothetical protein [Alloscardovia criceti]